MAQRMWRDYLLDTCRLGLRFHHDEYHHSREVGTPTVEEHIILLTGFYLHPVSVHKPISQFLDGLVGNGNQPFLITLADDSDEFLVEVKVTEF